MSTRVRVLCDASPLCDDRRTAGIGRYVERLTAALGSVDGLELRVVVPHRPPLRNAWTVRWSQAQPGLAVATLGWRPQLLHAMASEPALGMPLHRQVVTVHDAVPWEPGLIDAGSVTARYLAWQGRRLPRCAAVIVPSPQVATEAIERLGLDSSRVHVVSEGVDPIFRAEAAADDNAIRLAAGVGETGYILWVGSLVTPDPRKGLDSLVAATTALPGARLVMAGRTGPAADLVRAHAARAGARLQLTGWVDDAALAALYRGAAILAMPSHHEGFGLPVLEAMACGTPIVAGRAGNLPDLAADAAELVPPGDAPALAEAMRRLLADPQARARLAAAGPRRAAAYTWKEAAERTAAVYAAALRAGEATARRSLP